MALSDSAKGESLDAVLGDGSPATVYAALRISGTEVSGNGYSRVAVTNDATSFPPASGSGTVVKTNGVEITFPTATGSWGTVNEFALYDAASGGSPRWTQTLTTARSVALNDRPYFPVGALRLSA